MGNIDIADTYNNRIQRYGPNGCGYRPTTTGSYTAVVTSAAGCSVISDTVVINPIVTPSVTISATYTTITTGATDTFTATPTNGGTTPSYQWYKNGVAVGTNSATYITGTLSNNDSVWCVMTSNAPCASPATATSNHVHVTVNPIPTPVITRNGSILSTTTIGTYQWFRDSVAIPTATQQRDSIAQNGNYYVAVTVNGCTGESNVLHISNVGIKEVSIDGSIKLYPNPNNGSFTLETSQMLGAEYTVYDMLGQIIQQQAITADVQRLDMGSVASGVYMLVIKGKDGSIRFTVMR